MGRKSTTKISRRSVLQLMGASVVGSSLRSSFINNGCIDNDFIDIQPHVLKGGIISVTPEETDSALINPCMGWVTHFYSGRTGNSESVPELMRTSTFNIGFLTPQEFFNEFTMKMEQRPGSDFAAGPVTPVTKPGLYDLFVSVGKKDGTPLISLPLTGDDGQHRYKIGRILVKEPSVPGMVHENFYIDK